MLLFGRLMERNTKHHCVTYSLTLFSDEFLSDSVMQIARLNRQLVPYQLCGARILLVAAAVTSGCGFGFDSTEILL